MYHVKLYGDRRNSTRPGLLLERNSEQTFCKSLCYLGVICLCSARNGSGCYRKLCKVILALMRFSLHVTWFMRPGTVKSASKLVDANTEPFVKLFSMDAKFELIISHVGCREQLSLKI